MRGASARLPAKEKSLRITPAHAGSIKTMLYEGILTRDHPRACGEHQARAVAGGGRTGSPPRMRGAFAPWAIFS